MGLNFQQLQQMERTYIKKIIWPFIMINCDNYDFSNVMIFF